MASKTQKTKTTRTKTKVSGQDPNRIKECVKITEQIPAESARLTIVCPDWELIDSFWKDKQFNIRRLGKALFDAAQPGGIAAVVLRDETARGPVKSLDTFRLVLDWCGKGDKANKGSGSGSGWNLFETLIYQREGASLPSWSRRFRRDHDSILVFFKGEVPWFFSEESIWAKASLVKGAKSEWWKAPGKHSRTKTGQPIDIGSFKDVHGQGTVWQYPEHLADPLYDGTDGVHNVKLRTPGDIPGALTQDLIRCFSRRGDLVLDPMDKNGTTCASAVKLGRKYLGFNL